MKVKAYRKCDICGRRINVFSFDNSDRYYVIKAWDFDSKRYKIFDREVCGNCMDKVEYEVSKLIKEAE